MQKVVKKSRQVYQSSFQGSPGLEILAIVSANGPAAVSPVEADTAPDIRISSSFASSVSGGTHPRLPPGTGGRICRITASRETSTSQSRVWPAGKIARSGTYRFRMFRLIVSGSTAIISARFANRHC